MPGTPESENRLTNPRDGSDAACSVVNCADNVNPYATGKSTRIGASVSASAKSLRSLGEVSFPRPKNGISGRWKCLMESVTCGIRNEPASWARYQSNCMCDTP